MNLLETLQSLGYSDIIDCGDEYRARPLYRDSDNRTSLCIYKKDGSWYDFGAQIGGPLIQLVKLSKDFSSDEEASKFLESVQYSSPIIIPKYFHDLSSIKTFDKQLLLKLEKDHSYWVKRGINETTVSRFKGGITKNGRMSNRYVFPIFNEQNDLVGFSGRLLEENPSYPKWKILGAKKSFVYPVYPFNQNIDFHERTILVESIGDMLALAEIGVHNVIVTFGLNVSERIILFLLKHDCQSIILLFNNDSSLSGNNASKKNEQILSRFFDVCQIQNVVPTHKDVNEFLLADRAALVTFCQQIT